MFTVYAVYVVITLLITVGVAQNLAVHGRPFLVQVFHRNETLADAVNRFLVVGFYLVNIGFILLTMKDRRPVEGLQSELELLGSKIGLAVLSLGAMHFANLFVFCRIRVATRFGVARTRDARH